MERERQQVEDELKHYGEIVKGRDDLLRRARAAGVSKHRMHVLTGIARTTIDRTLDRRKS